jgi:hypothetical protein
MKPLPLLKLLLPSLALAFVACSSSSTPDGGTTTGAQNTTAANNGGSTSSGGNSGGSTSGGGTGTTGSANGGSSGGSTGTVYSIGSPCDLPAVDSPGAPGDPCVNADLACSNLNPSASGMDYTGTCQLPVEYETCSSTIGCAQTPVAYSCFLFPAGGGSPAESQCLQSCTATVDCNDVTDECWPTADLSGITSSSEYCYSNVCGPGSGAYDITQVDNGTFYGPCTVVSGNDGYCVPFNLGTPAPLGLCYPLGTAATNESCTTDRPVVDGGTFCVSGDYCLSSLAAITPTDQGYCTPFCAADSLTGDGGALAPGDVDAGPLCDTGSVCAQLFGGIYWGVCGTSCDPGANTSDAGANSACATPDNNCYQNTAPDAGFCGP